MNNNLTTKNRPVMITVKTKDKVVKTMVQNDQNTKAELDKMTNEYLNEKLYYFYNNGGPIMDI